MSSDHFQNTLVRTEELIRDGHTCKVIANVLDAEGYRAVPPLVRGSGQTFDAALVLRLLRQCPNLRVVWDAVPAQVRRRTLRMYKETERRVLKQMDVEIELLYLLFRGEPWADEAIMRLCSNVESSLPFRVREYAKYLTRARRYRTV